jgi:predicted S18 family serine protease
MKHYQRQRRTGNAFTRNEQRESEKQKLLDDLYEVYRNTENEEAFNIIGRAIDFVKKG